MKELNFTMYCRQEGLSCDYDIVDHGMLGPSGKRSKRAHKRSMIAMEGRIASNQTAHEQYRALILSGDIIDPSGETTAQGLTLAQNRIDKRERQGQLDVISSKIRFIESLGSMSHKKNGALRKSYQSQVDEMETERKLLVA